MSLHVIQVDPGGEYLLPWARKKLEYWHQEMLHAGRRSVFKIVQVSDGRMIYANSELVAPGVFIDKIKVVGGMQWGFLVRDTAGSGAQLVGHFAALDVRGFLRVKLADESTVGIVRAVRTNGKSMLLCRDDTVTDSVVAGWRWVNDKTALRVFEPATFGDESNVPSGTGEAVDAQESKLVAMLDITADPDTGKWLSDGTDYQVLSPPAFPSQQYVLATESDGFAVSQSDGPAGIGVTTKAVSLANGAFMDSSFGVHADDEMGDPKVNLTDLFQFQLFTADPLADPNRAVAFYRNGALEYATVGTPGDAFLQLCSARGVHAFIDETFWRTVPTTDARLTVVKGVRDADGIYSYTEQSILVDTATEYPSVGGAQGVSLAEGYYFVAYISNVVADSVLKAISSAGDITQIHSFTSQPSFQASAISFAALAVLIGIRINASSWRRIIFFGGSDGSFTEAELPVAARHAIVSHIVGSNTLAYAHILDTSLIRYLVDSTGVVTALPLPTRTHPTDPAQPDQTATSVSVRGFIDQKVGCRLLFEANWATAPTRSYHHWNEEGEIFNYGTPAFSYTGGRNMVVPEPSSIDRMKLLETWNP